MMTAESMLSKRPVLRFPVTLLFLENLSWHVSLLFKFLSDFSGNIQLTFPPLLLRSDANGFTHHITVNQLTTKPIFLHFVTNNDLKLNYIGNIFLVWLVLKRTDVSQTVFISRSLRVKKERNRWSYILMN